MKKQIIASVIVAVFAEVLLVVTEHYYGFEAAVLLGLATIYGSVHGKSCDK